MQVESRPDLQVQVNPTVRVTAALSKKEKKT
jgi:hypothetical protein